MLYIRDGSCRAGRREAAATNRQVGRSSPALDRTPQIVLVRPKYTRILPNDWVSKMFATLICIRPLPGCDMNPSDINGAEVTCYIPALDEGTARELLMESLREHRFRLMGEKWFVDDVEMELSPVMTRICNFALWRLEAMHDLPNDAKSGHDEHDSPYASPRAGAYGKSTFSLAMLLIVITLLSVAFAIMTYLTQRAVPSYMCPRRTIHLHLTFY